MSNPQAIDLPPVLEVESFLKRAERVLKEVDEEKAFQDFEQSSKCTTKLKELVEKKKKWTFLIFWSKNLSDLEWSFR